MLHFVYQLIANFVCLLFCAAQVLCSGVRFFSLKMATNRQNNKVVGCEAKTMSWKLTKNIQEQRGTADLSDNYVKANKPFNIIEIWSILNIEILNSAALKLMTSVFKTKNFSITLIFT